MLASGAPTSSRSVATGRWLAIGAALVALPLAILTVAGTRYWPGRPFPGFFVLENAVVPTVGLYGWTGLGGGVPFHARVLAADGQTIGTNADLYRYVEARPVGTPVTYALEEGGRTLSRTVPTMRFGARDYWLTVGLMSVLGVFTLLTGIGVALLQPHGRSVQGFLLAGVAAGLFMLTGTALYHPTLSWLSPLHLVTQAVFPATYIHVGLTFPVERRFVARRPGWLLVPYAVAGLLSLWMVQAFYAPEPETTSLHATYLWVAIALAVLVGCVGYSYRENATPAVRRQVRAMFPGLALGAAAAMFGFLDNARATPQFPIHFLALAPLPFYLSVGYAIVRHDLFDIDALLKQAVLYATLTLGITAAYAGAVASLGQVLSPQAVRASPLFNIAFVVLVALLFEPLRSTVQRAIDRVFYRDRPDYRRTVSEVSAALTSLLDLDEILARLGHTVTESFQLSSLAVLLWFDDRVRVWRYHAEEETSDARHGWVEEGGGVAWGAIAGLLARTPRWPVALDGEMGRRPSVPADAAARDEMQRLGAILLVPLTLGSRALGAFALGPRRSGLPFSSEELELVDTLAAQSAIAIQNALSYRALQALNAALDAKVRARTAELEASNNELGLAYRDLKAAQSQLLQTEKLASLGQLVAGVAHEINNPVSFIVGNIEPLRERLEALRGLAVRHDDQEIVAMVDRIRRAFEIIARGAERTAGIVQDLRTFSRVGEALPRPVDIQESIEVSLRLLRPRWADRITIHRAYAPLPPVEAAPGQLNQVFMNVLANACDAIIASGNIWLETVAANGDVIVTVRDDGAGVPSEHLHRIFDPFFTTKPQGKGTGLGLAISHGIVTGHGGRIEVASEPGRGSTFRIVLPMQADDAARRAGSGEVAGTMLARPVRSSVA